jgi:hypothetical protein
LNDAKLAHTSVSLHSHCLGTVGAMELKHMYQDGMTFIPNFTKIDQVPKTFISVIEMRSSIICTVLQILLG